MLYFVCGNILIHSNKEKICYNSRFQKKYIYIYYFEKNFTTKVFNLMPGSELCV